MSRGGKRKGAGRKPAHEVGVIVRLSKESASMLNELAKLTGETPRDYLARVIRELYTTRE